MTEATTEKPVERPASPIPDQRGASEPVAAGIRAQVSTGERIHDILQRIADETNTVRITNPDAPTTGTELVPRPQQQKPLTEVLTGTIIKPTESTTNNMTASETVTPTLLTEEQVDSFKGTVVTPEGNIVKSPVLEISQSEKTPKIGETENLTPEDVENFTGTVVDQEGNIIPKETTTAKQPDEQIQTLQKTGEPKIRSTETKITIPDSLKMSAEAKQTERKEAIKRELFEAYTTHEAALKKIQTEYQNDPLAHQALQEMYTTRDEVSRRIHNGTRGNDQMQAQIDRLMEQNLSTEDLLRIANSATTSLEQIVASAVAANRPDYTQFLTTKLSTYLQREHPLQSPMGKEITTKLTNGKQNEIDSNAMQKSLEAATDGKPIPKDTIAEIQALKPGEGINPVLLTLIKQLILAIIAQINRNRAVQQETKQPTENNPSTKNPQQPAIGSLPQSRQIPGQGAQPALSAASQQAVTAPPTPPAITAAPSAK